MAVSVDTYFQNMKKIRFKIIELITILSPAVLHTLALIRQYQFFQYSSKSAPNLGSTYVATPVNEAQALKHPALATPRSINSHQKHAIESNSSSLTATFWPGLSVEPIDLIVKMS